MITTVLFLLLIVLIILYVVITEKRPPNYPPGPAWWPFVGNEFLLRKLSKKLKGQHLALSKIAKDYKTSILGLRLGRDLVVVTLTLEANRAVLTRDVFTGRPLSFFMKLRCFGKRRGITSTDGYEWKEQRAFTVRHLKQFGYGKEVMEDMIMDEVRELIRSLRKEEVVESISDMTAPSVLNVLWALATGKRLEKDDPKLKKLLKLLSRRSRAFDMAGGALSQMPWLRFVAPNKTGFSLLQELNTEIKNFLIETIDEQKKTFKPNVIRNLIDAFLHERNSKTKFSSFSDDELAVLLLDLFIGGAQTTGQTLDFAFLLMIKYPEIQKKVRQNIIENVGKSRLPTVEDKPKLVYTEAVILEVMRKFCVVPIIGPRRSLQDTTLNGYYIPKNTTILLNLYTVHHDERLFPDPHRFHPERFISSDGLHLVNHENILTFGLGKPKENSLQIFAVELLHRNSLITGKRRCLGEALAKSSLFLIFAGLLQNFEITKVSDDKELSMEPLLGLTLAPRPYSARFRSLWSI